MNKENFFEMIKKTRQIGFQASFEEIREIAIENWGKEIGKMKPSYFPNEQDSLVLFRGNHNKTHHSPECFSFIKDRELQYPNVHGLVICELIDREFDFLKIGDVLIAYDYLHHLALIPKFGHAVPYLMKDGEDEYSHNWFPWTGYLDHDELLLGYRKA